MLYTSGNAPGAENAMRLLRENGARRCAFSVFSSSEEHHDRVTRVAGSLAVTLAAMRRAKEVGLQTELHFVPLRRNYRELDAICELGRRLGVEQVSVLRFVPQGRGSLLKEETLTKAENVRLRRSIERLRGAGLRIRTGSPYNFLMLNRQPECQAGTHTLIIGPDLCIYPCDAFKQVKAEEIVGTVNCSTFAEASLEECWTNSPYLCAVRDYLNTPFGEPCCSCPELRKCLSGCLAQKFIAHGDLRKRPDPMCLLN